MKVTVTKNLNVRVGAPRLSADCYQYLAPGSILEVEDKLYEGDVFEGSSDWYRDGAGNYYWAGGVERTSREFVKPLIENNYLDALPLPKEWKNKKGEGVQIFVLDSGCTKHTAFENRLLPLYDGSTKAIGDFFDEEGDGHGTFVSGLIGGRFAPHFTGIAPKAHIKPYMITQGGQADSNFLANCLDHILLAPTQNEILNLSLTIDESDFLRKKIENLLNLNTLIVAAIPNEADIFSSKLNFFPAMVKGVIAVAKISQDQISLVGTRQINPGISYLIPDVKYTSASAFNTIQTLKNNGSSFATGIVSGVFACAKSANPLMSANQLKSLVNGLVPSVSHISDTTFNLYKNVS